MKIEIFQSSHGDCLMLESADGHRILCDGGMTSSMKQWVIPELAARHERDPGYAIDLAYVSHIDADHIGGILVLLQDLVDWKVHDHHAAAGDDFAPPDRPRPPAIGGIWHNAFHDQVEENTGKIEDMLAAAAPVLFATQAPEGLAAGFSMQNISLGVDQALQVTRLVDAGVLGLPVNQLPGAKSGKKLLLARPGQAPVAFGSMEISIIGPTTTELELLREGWNNWLKRSQKRLAEIDEELRKRVDAFASGADGLALGWEGVDGFKGVTVPNLASLVLLVSEGGKRVLMTGDAQHDKLLDQMKGAGLLADGHVHLDVLKVQHHGSENNVDRDFARTVSADHYIFCGDGKSGNPDPKVLQIVFDSRMSDDPKVRAAAPEAAGRPFHFWFSTSTAIPSDSISSRATYMKVEALVNDLVAQSGGRMSVHFNSGPSITLEL